MRHGEIDHWRSDFHAEKEGADEKLQQRGAGQPAAGGHCITPVGRAFANVVCLLSKVAGYAGFAYCLNRVLDRAVSPPRFAIAKTAVGLVGGIIYLWALVPLLHIDVNSDAAMFAGAIPVRMIAWSDVLALFYGYRKDRAIIAGAVLLGTLWSYLLDGAMILLFRLPGMTMPFC